MSSTSLLFSYAVFSLLVFSQPSYGDCAFCEFSCSSMDSVCHNGEQLCKSNRNTIKQACWIAPGYPEMVILLGEARRQGFWLAESQCNEYVNALGKKINVKLDPIFTKYIDWYQEKACPCLACEAALAVKVERRLWISVNRMQNGVPANFNDEPVTILTGESKEYRGDRDCVMRVAVETSGAYMVSAESIDGSLKQSEPKFSGQADASPGAYCFIRAEAAP